jgi:hypothetical protein
LIPIFAAMLSANPLLAALAALALSSLAAGAAVPASASATADLPQPSDDAGLACQSGLYILTVGGTQCGEESKHSCQVGHVAQQLVQSVPGSLQVTIGYDAVKGDNYSQSLLTGIKPLKHHIQRYAAACPDSRLVLMGYSRGAQVVTDTLAGTGGDKTGEKPLNDALKKHSGLKPIFGPCSKLTCWSFGGDCVGRSVVQLSVRKGHCQGDCAEPRRELDLGEEECD